MPELVVENLQGLNEVPEASPEGLVQPNEAVIAENVDPFRGPKGSVVPAMKFDNFNAAWPDRYAGSEAVATIRFADKVLVSTAVRDQGGRFVASTIQLHLLGKGAQGRPQFNLVPFNTSIGYEYDVLPKRWVVDPHVYEWKSSEWGTIRYYNLYLYGWRPAERWAVGYRPMRIVYSIDEQGEETWVYIPMNIKHLDIISSLYTHWTGAEGGDFTGWYLYLFILRDVAGNLFVHSVGWENPYEKVELYPKTYAWLDLWFDITPSTTLIALKHLGIRYIDIYRQKVARTTGWVSGPRYVGTYDYNDARTQAYFEDTKPDDNDLADLPEYAVDQLPALCYNIDGAADGVVGLWQNRLVFSVKNEIMWSATALNTAYGNRFLNFPATNHHSFVDIGTITDLLEQRDNLVALSTSGIATLYGSTLANMYSEKVDDASSVFFPNFRNDYGQWWWTAVNFDDEIIFIDSVGRPRIFDGRDARLLGDKVIIPRKKDYEGKTLEYNVDAVRYRNGYIIATGEKIYVWCRDGDRWATWRRGAFKKRFLRPNDPWLDEEFVTNRIPFEKPKILQTGNRSYLYLFDNRGDLYSYGAREDDYPVNMRWRVPRVPFKGENYFRLLKLKWAYLPYDGYERYEGSTPEESIDLGITPWLDDEEEPNGSRRETVSLVDEVKPGTYQCLIPLSVRANRLGYDLQVSHGRFFALSGYGLVYEPKGKRTYGR